MINGPTPLDNTRLSASGSLSSDFGPTKARLDTTGYASAWIPKVSKVANGRPFIQVTLLYALCAPYILHNELVFCAIGII